MTAARYVGLLLPLQLAAGCSQQAEAPPVEQAKPSVGQATGAPQADQRLVLALGDSLYAGYGVAQAESFLSVLEGELEKRGIPVLLTGMMAPRNMDGAYFRSFDSIYPDLARKYGATLDPFFMDGVITERALLLDDGLHPNAAGIRKMAERIAPLAQQRLEQD